MTLSEQAAALVTDVTSFATAVECDDLMWALRAANIAAGKWGDVVADVAQAAYNEGATKRAIAAALGVPASTFRGMRKQVPA